MSSWQWVKTCPVCGFWGWMAAALVDLTPEGQAAYEFTCPSCGAIVPEEEAE